MQVQSEVVLFQGSLSCSGLSYAVEYILYISVSCAPSTIGVHFVFQMATCYPTCVWFIVAWELFSQDAWLADAINLGNYTE